jgi:predicted transcriptional regulator
LQDDRGRYDSTSLHAGDATACAGYRPEGTGLHPCLGDGTDCTPIAPSPDLGRRPVVDTGRSRHLVTQLRYIAPMKTTTIPSIRVEPDFRAEVEAVLAEGETLSQFVEASVRASVERRRMQAEFIARGLRSREAARRTGDYVDADEVVDGLQRKLDAARSRLAKKRK